MGTAGLWLPIAHDVQTYHKAGDHRPVLKASYDRQKSLTVAAPNAQEHPGLANLAHRPRPSLRALLLPRASLRALLLPRASPRQRPHRQVVPSTMLLPSQPRHRRQLRRRAWPAPPPSSRCSSYLTCTCCWIRVHAAFRHGRVTEHHSVPLAPFSLEGRIIWHKPSRWLCAGCFLRNGTIPAEGLRVTVA